MTTRQTKITNYFSHDSNARNDAKLVNLRMKHGAAGYGVYFMILERMREEANYMSAKDYNMIAFDLRVDAALVKSVVEDFGLFVFTSSGEYFYSESFNSRMEVKDTSAAKRSAAGKKGMATRWSARHVETTADTEPAPVCQPDYTTDDDEFYNRFFAADNSANIEVLLKNFGLKPNDKPLLKAVAKDVVAEWKLSKKTHPNYTDWSQHLISLMRIRCERTKNDEAGEPPAATDYQYSGGFGSKDV